MSRLLCVGPVPFLGSSIKDIACYICRDRLTAHTKKGVCACLTKRERQRAKNDQPTDKRTNKPTKYELTTMQFTSTMAMIGDWFPYFVSYADAHTRTSVGKWIVNLPAMNTVVHGRINHRATHPISIRLRLIPILDDWMNEIVKLPTKRNAKN